MAQLSTKKIIGLLLCLGTLVVVAAGWVARSSGETSTDNAYVRGDVTSAGEVDVPDGEAGARQFLGMLHGNIHLEAVLQVGEMPTLSEIDWRARTAVKVFLDGAKRDERGEVETLEGQVDAL